MPAAVRVREDFSAAALRALTKRAKDANQSRRLLSLAAMRDGMDCGAAAKIGGMDRQTLRDWVHRFDAEGPAALLDHWTSGPTPRLKSAVGRADRDRRGRPGSQDRRRRALAAHGPHAHDAERFGVDYHVRYVGTLLKKLGFSHVSARPRHPAQDERIIEAFKNTSPPS